MKNTTYPIILILSVFSSLFLGYMLAKDVNTDNKVHFKEGITGDSLVNTIMDEYKRHRGKEYLKKYILEFEGGYIVHPKIYGGATNKGVTYGTFVHLSHKLNYENSWKVFRVMPDSVWSKIFNRFWDKSMADSIDDIGLAMTLVDFSWSSGPANVKKFLNGYFGVNKDYSELIGLVNNSNREKLLEAIYNKRVGIAKSMPKFTRGWVRRLKKLRRVIRSCNANNPYPHNPYILI